MITRSADSSRRPLLAWLASALVVTLIETWRALPDGSWSASYLLLLFAVTAAISGAWTVVLVPPDNRLSQSGTLLTQQALESAGVPVLRISADMVDAKEWDHHRMVEHVGEFLRSKELI